MHQKRTLSQNREIDVLAPAGSAILGAAALQRQGVDKAQGCCKDGI